MAYTHQSNIINSRLDLWGRGLIYLLLMRDITHQQILAETGNENSKKDIPVNGKMLVAAYRSKSQDSHLKINQL